MNLHDLFRSGISIRNCTDYIETMHKNPLVSFTENAKCISIRQISADGLSEKAIIVSGSSPINRYEMLIALLVDAAFSGGLQSFPTEST